MNRRRRRVFLAFFASAVAFGTVAFARQPVTPQQSRTGPTPSFAVSTRDALRASVQIDKSPSDVVLPVRACRWRYGRGPTAVSMVVGCCDMLGYEDLIPGSAEDQTESVSWV